MGQKSAITPLAEYDIVGMIVSHNDPQVWYRFDISNDDKSLNTRDICIIWGDNLSSGDYRNIDFYNDDAFCMYDYGPNVQFYPNQLSNNHLITSNQAIRDQIAHLAVGDQIRIRGKLANYSEERWGGVMRRTSMSREDVGDGACEVLFVEQLDVLQSPNGFWYMLHHWFFIGAAICFGLCVLIILIKPVPRYKQKKGIKLPPTPSRSS